MKPRPVTTALLRAWPLPTVDAADDKEDRGRVLVVGGSQRVPGAALLAGIACLRAGAGKLQVATSRQAALALAIALPEAKVCGLATDARGEIARLDRDTNDAADAADAVLVGPGMEPGAATRRIATALLGRARVAVFDAGAIGSLRSRSAGTRSTRGEFVITPHHGEMAELLGIEVAEVDAQPLAIAREFARRSGAVVVLKSAATLVVDADGKAWRHAGACAGLGTSGSGDVLAGVICGLAAQGADVEQAAVWGVALHASAGRRLERTVGRTGFLAREIAQAIPGAREALHAR